MKILLVVVSVVLLAVAGYFIMNSKSDSKETMNEAPQTEADDTAVFMITPIRHATLVLDWAGKSIFVDPVGESKLFPQEKADLVLITDIHPDHFSSSTLTAVVDADTVIIAPQAVADMLQGSIKDQVTVMANGETASHADFSVETVPMYNLPEDSKSFHPKGRGNGYVVERDGIRVYVAGDTENTPEMKALKNINVAFVPMNLPYTMSVEDAADGVLAFAPQSVYPYHYKGESGFSDLEKFKALVEAGNPDIDVVLLDWYQGEAKTGE